MATPPTLFPKTSQLKGGKPDSQTLSTDKPAQSAAAGSAERPTSLYKPIQPSSFSGAGQSQPGFSFRTSAPAADASPS